MPSLNITENCLDRHLSTKGDQLLLFLNLITQAKKKFKIVIQTFTRKFVKRFQYFESSGCKKRRSRLYLFTHDS